MRCQAAWGLTPHHSQIYVHESIYEQFIAALKKKAEACAIGQAGLLVCSSDHVPGPGPGLISVPRETPHVLADAG